MWIWGMGMKFIDFFAGIGGFRRGLELSGHQCVGFCEWDKYAAASYTSMHLITEEQRKYLETLSLKQRQKEILKEEYRNGEWYSNDIRNVDAGSLPDADCWCFGAPCQDFSIAGKRAGLDGDRSSLIREIFRLLEEQKEQDRPEWLIYENVKGMLSSNRGLDYFSILSEMDRLGYDIEWQNINSKWWVPQNRERIYTVGHLRRCGFAKILPVTGSDGENSISIIGHRDGYRRNMQTFSPYGITETLDTGEGGGRGHHVGLPCFCDMNYGAGIKETTESRTIQARYYKGVCNRKAEISGVCVPVLTPDRAEKRQNGRRFKENGEPMFTLTAQDRHGVALGIIDRQGRTKKSVKPKELCPTLRSETHGNVPEVCLKCTGKNQEQTMVALGVLKSVRTDYGKKIRKDYESGKLKISRHKFLAYDIKTDGCSNTIDTVQKDNLLAIKSKVLCDKSNDGIYVEMPGGFLAYCVWYEKYQCYIAIRKLTPKECFRLQGWTDDYFEKAAFVNSDSQLYKQAGNGVTVDVVKAIGDKIMEYEKASVRPVS